MSDPTKGPPAGATGEQAPVEQDHLFRLQMAVSDFVLGNARYFGALLGLVLLVALVYGGVTSFLDARASDEFAAIARIDHKMPAVEPAARMGLVPMDDKSDTQRMANVEEGARRYQALAETSHGAAAVLGYLKAADAWARVGKSTERVAALERASAVGAKGLPGYAADAAYAAALVDAGRTDDALKLHRDMVGRQEGFLAEASLLLLVRAQISAGRDADARLTVDEFKARFPQSPRLAEMDSLAQRIGSKG